MRQRERPIPSPVLCVPGLFPTRPTRVWLTGVEDRELIDALRSVENSERFSPLLTCVRLSASYVYEWLTDMEYRNATPELLWMVRKVGGGDSTICGTHRNGAPVKSANLIRRLPRRRHLRLVRIEEF